MTHKAKDCCERPRKVGAKWTNQDIQPDEVVKEVNLDWDGKRDRWNGYDAENHLKLIEQYSKYEQERQRKKKEESLLTTSAGKEKKEGVLPKGEDSEGEEDSEHEDEDKKDFLDTTEGPVGVKKDPRTRTTIRNLRIREDTAKYLKDLSADAPHYDPKSRSMRAPIGSKNYNDTTDAFVRQSETVQEFNQLQGFSFTAYEKGQAIHLQALPSQAELVYKKYVEKKEMLNNQNKDSILSKYGDQSSYHEIDSRLLHGQTEQFTEFTHDGTLLNFSKTNSKNIPISKYDEDVYINNHTSVWGSFWENGVWGYACCHQTVKRSYCTGEAGKRAHLEMKEDMVNRQKAFAKLESSETTKLPTPAASSNSLKGYSTLTGNKRTLGYAELSQEEYSNYLMKKARTDDPMKDFVSQEN
jgi:pre-mRNA-processing factor SLU7